MSSHRDNPIFHDEDAARAWFEARIWPNGPFCPHCGEVERVTRLQGKAHRPGVFQCNSCREQFTVTVNTVENYCSILKLGIIGIYHHVSETHLHRYAAEFDFRYNHRVKLSYDDMQ